MLIFNTIIYSINLYHTSLHLKHHITITVTIICIIIIIICNIIINIKYPTINQSQTSKFPKKSYNLFRMIIIIIIKINL